MLEAFAQAGVDILATIGEDATYTPAGGETASPKVNVETEVEGQPNGMNGTAWVQIQTIEGLLSEFGQEPNVGDTITVGATTYTVKRVIENDGIFVKVAVK